MYLKKMAYPSLLGALALVLSACGGAEQSAAETTRVTMAHDGSTQSAAVSLGIDQGFFREEGLEIEYTTVGQPSATVAALQSGELDVGSVPTIPAIYALAQGINLTALAGSSGYPSDGQDMNKYDTISIYVSPNSSITRPKDLEGKNIGLPGRGTVHEVLVSNAILEDGGDPTKVQWIVLDNTSRVSFLIEGKVDAAGLSSPFVEQAADRGAKLLEKPGIDFYQEGGLISAWFASQKIAADSDLMAKLQRAIHKSNTYANENINDAKKRAAEITGISFELLDKADGFNYFPTTLSEDDLKKTNQKLVDLGFQKQMVDFSTKSFASVK